MQYNAKASAKNNSIKKPSLREKYLQEKEMIKHEIGDLDQIRTALGYSQRKLCQILLVDPSAWTRWLKSPQGAPPHIYQALHWLLKLSRLDPQAAAPSNLSQRVDTLHTTTNSRIQELESHITQLKEALSLLMAQREAPTVIHAAPIIRPRTVRAKVKKPRFVAKHKKVKAKRTNMKSNRKKTNALMKVKTRRKK